MDLFSKSILEFKQDLGVMYPTWQDNIPPDWPKLLDPPLCRSQEFWREKHIFVDERE
jgi:hypothetical protein